MAKPVTIYGIPNCDTMKKARTWLGEHGVAFVFHDYRVDGIDGVTLDGWVKKAGWEIVLNRASTTFRALPENKKQDLTAAKAIALMLEQPSMIKRPVLIAGKDMLVGFKPDQYAAQFA